MEIILEEKYSKMYFFLDNMEKNYAGIETIFEQVTNKNE